MAPSQANERVTGSFLELQRHAPFALAALTIRRAPTGSDEPIRSYGMTKEHVQEGVVDFIPRSRYFQSVLEAPEAILDWTQVPEFQETGMARDHLLTVGITQGMSFALMNDKRVVGSLHFNFSGISTFSDQQYEALATVRSELQREVAAYVLAGDVGLTRREREVLSLVADGLTNAQIGDALHLSRHTVNTHIENIFAKLRVSNRIQAVRHAVLIGLA